MKTFTLTLASGIAVPAILAAVIYYLVSKKRTFQTTTFSKIIIGFFIISSAINIFSDLYFHFENTYPEAIPDYRLLPIIGSTLYILVFMFPIVVRKSRYFAFSFYYVLANLFFYTIFGALIPGITGNLLIPVIKFIVVLCALLQSLKTMAEPSP